MSPSSSLHDPILATLHRVVHRHSSARRVSEQVSDSPNYVSRLLGGRIKLRVDVLERILAALDISPAAFFHEALGTGEIDPAELVRLGRELDHVEPSPRIGRLLERCATLAASVDGEHALDPQLDLEIDSWCARRGRDPEQAADELLDTLEACLDGARLASRAQVADAVSALASMLRVLSQRGSAADLTAAAWKLVRSAESPFHEGRVLQRAAVLLVATGRPEFAAPLATRATDAFARAGCWQSLAKSLVTRATVATRLERPREAKALYEAAVRQLPANEVPNLFAAWQGLSYCHQQLGDLSAAVRALEAARRVYGERCDAQRPWLEWRAGSLALELGELDAACRAFELAIERFEEFAQLIDAALVAVELAEAHWQAGRPAASRRACERVLPWLEAFVGNPMAEAALWELLRLAGRGELTLAALQATRCRLDESRRAAASSR
ncbi:MAG: tetratricopeptide repeat protein [Acidobacteriota bacterium]